MIKIPSINNFKMQLKSKDNILIVLNVSKKITFMLPGCEY